MLPYNSQESSYNFLTTSNCLSYHDFPAPSDNSFLLQSQQFVTCYQEPKLNICADRTKQRSEGQRKIMTKQGLREPRVRLSVEVAHKFFKLQDLLGFEKASATVGWLIDQSRVSIEQHLNVDFSDVLYGKREQNFAIPRKALKSKNERRKEARTRARERTMEKKIKLMMERDGPNVDDDQPLFSSEQTVYYCQDYLDGSYHDYMNSFCEHLDGSYDD